MYTHTTHRTYKALVHTTSRSSHVATTTSTDTSTNSSTSREREREREKKGRRLRRPLNTNTQRGEGREAKFLCVPLSLTHCLSSTYYPLSTERVASNERRTRRTSTSTSTTQKGGQRVFDDKTSFVRSSRSFVRSFVAKTTTSWRASIFFLSHYCFVAVGRRRRGGLGGLKRGGVAR